MPLASALRSATPSASSSRIVVASVKGRRPDKTFSRVEIEILARSASCCRDIRRRAISSRTVAATIRLCSEESCFSDTSIVSPREIS
jgi:hypothetical protein